MAGCMKVVLKQRAKIESLTAEGIAPSDIHRQMSAAYGEECVERSTARRCVRGNLTKNQDTPNVHYKPHCGQPKTADSAEYRERVNKLICEQSVFSGVVGISR